MASFLRSAKRVVSMCINNGRHLNKMGSSYFAPKSFILEKRHFNSTTTVDEDFPRLILDIENGSKVPGVFSVGEIQRRLSMLRTHMADNDIEATLLTSYHNVCYFSGYLYTAFGRPYGLVVDHDKSTLITAGVDAGHPWRRVIIGDNISYTDFQKDNFFYAIQHLLPNCRGQLGCELDDINLERLRKLENALPDASIVDIGVPSMNMRLIKSQEEINLTKKGAQIANAGARAGMAAITHNVPEYKIAQIMTNTMEDEIAKSYPDLEIKDTLSWLTSSLHTDCGHHFPTSRKIQKGDCLSLNCFPMISGYYIGLERTLFLDHASDKQLEMWDANCEVYRASVELITPGAKCSDIAHELNEIYRQRGLLKYRTFGYGHSMGLMCHYYGREAALEFREDVETVLKPNMVLSMEPMIMIPEGIEGTGGYREHDIFVVTDTGAENITNFPFGKENNIIVSK